MIRKTLLMTALAALGVSLAPALALAGGLPDSQIQNMMSIQTQPADVNATAFDTIQGAGFGMIRKGIYWTTVESKKGVYDFTYTDSLFSDIKSRGMMVSVTLYGNNSLYETSSTPGITTAAGRQGFANFAAALAARYKGYPIIFEIWNEPDLTSFWHSPSNSNVNADQYTALVNEVAPAMHKADPSAFVVGGSISTLWDGSPGSFQWFNECVKQGLLTSGINGISQHPYGVSYPELIISAYNELRSKMNAGGASSMPIVTTEVGYNIDWIVQRQGFTSAQAENVQGWMLVRQQLVDQMSGIKYSNWYQFRDATGQWPLVTQSYAALPPYEAAKTYTAQLSGYSYLKRITQTNANDFVAIFQNSAGHQKAVVWTSNLNKTDALSVAVTASGSVNVVDVFGTASQLSVASGSVKVNATNSPQYLDIGGTVVSTPTPAPTATPTPAPTATPTPAPTATPSPVSGATNLALGLLPTTTSGATSAHFLTDGKLTTNSRWMSAYGYPQAVTIDLGGTHSISQVNYLQAVSRTSAYKVEVYNGSAWVTVSTNAANAATSINASFTAIQGSKVRFTVTSGSLYQKVYEMQVMGN